MVDPNDFTDKDTPEGEDEGNPKAGRFGVGGLSTSRQKNPTKMLLINTLQMM